MNKDNYRDYVTEAYRYYAMCGKPDQMEVRQVKNVLPPHCRGGLADLEAVNRVIERLRYEPDGDMMLRCMEIVYFTDPKHMASRGEMSSRVGRAAMELNTSESTVYRSMRRLRLLMAIERGLRVEESELIMLFERSKQRNAPRNIARIGAEKPLREGLAT